MESVVDPIVAQALNTDMAKEASAAGATRTRMWDNFGLAVSQSQITALNSPTIFASTGIRFLNGTPTMPPGAAPNANNPVG